MTYSRCRWYTAPIIIIALVLIAGPRPANAGPEKMSYQGKATDAAGNPLPNGTYSFSFALYDHPTMGSERWWETAQVTVADGLFNHRLGSAIPIPLWLFPSYDSLFLEVSIGPQRLSPRTPIVSAGYAMSVNCIDGAYGGTIVDYLVVQGDAGSSSVQFPSNALDRTEMLDEPGVGSDNTASVTLTGTPQFLAGRTMVAPTDGYVLVVATAHASILHTNGTQSTCVFGLSDDMSTYVTSTMSRITLPSIMPSAIYEFPIATQAIFPISAGSQAYYALGSRTGSTSAVVYDVQLSEVFFATAYTTVSTPMPPSGTATAASAPFDPDAERLEAEAFNRKRMDEELARITAELEALKQRMQQEEPTPAKGRKE